MCGVACVVAPLARTEREAVCAAMTDALAHRGPDGHGLWSQSLDPRRPDGPGISLGHRRLAIVDPTAGGAQPMHRDGLSLVWNGEIYPHRTLRRELSQSGVLFHSDSDTEVLLALIRQRGLRAALQAVEGPLALILWNHREHTLSLARDRFGKKQLYLLRQRDTLLVASEPKAIVVGAERLGIPLSVDRQTLARYLADAEQEADDATFFAQIKRVAPAELVTFPLSPAPRPIPSPERSLYYVLRPDPSPPREHGAFLEAFRARLARSLSLRLDCEVPVGALLSGGMDSSSLVCLAHQLGQHTPTFSAVHTPGDPCDESQFIQAVLDKTQVPHHRVVPATKLTADSFVRFVYQQDEPTGGASVFAQACVFDLVRATGHKVVVSGQGADEALTGYGGSQSFCLAEQLRRGHWLDVQRELRRKPSVKHALYSLLQAGWLSARQALPMPLTTTLLELKWQRAFRGLPFFHVESLGLPRLTKQGPLTSEYEARSLLHGYLYRLLTGSSLLTILRTEDRSSMAVGVESRAPFLDHHLVELCMACPPKWLLREGRTKSLLRDSLSDVLPFAIVDRRDKIGFAAPELRYLQGPLSPLLRDTLSGSQLADCGLLDEAALLRALSDPAASPQTSHAAWKALSVELWLRAFSLTL
ncbi:MAG: asparagine synthase (glutamine-hydrolyzing) [Myxococcales bacterium]|nr:asparagine synthase (glutamine-hydrolyzing) [Myxococcales bacterium]